MNQRKKRPAKKIVIIKGSCRQCGNCCSHINICEEGKWVSKPRHFKKIVAETPEYSRFKILGKNDNGTLNFNCTWLNENGTCKDYTNRLDICRDFPDNMAIMNKGI
ncbi:MAG: YkgJ family cysteine cluster protein, partial [Candidatus Magnetomorum sp.]|nr:YkgJ family cysteine cluster protein [Candidatus Magnetomorum sp.]